MDLTKQRLKFLADDDSGQNLIEYALIAAVLGLGTVAAVSGVAHSVANVFAGAGNTLTNATS